MVIELNDKRYRVKRYKGEELNIYYFKGILVDDIPKHYSVCGIFEDEDYGNVGVIDTMPTVISLGLSWIMLCISAVIIAISVDAFADGDSFAVYTAELEDVISTEVTVIDNNDIENYEHIFEFNRHAYFIDNTLQLDVVCEEECHVAVYKEDATLLESNLEQGEHFSPKIDKVDGMLHLVVSFGNESYSNIVRVYPNLVDLQRVRVTATNDEIVSTLVDSSTSDVQQYAYFKNNKYVDAEIIIVQDVKCIHIRSNLDISKSYWYNDYHTPIVIGYTDTSSYNMILGNGDKRNVPENVVIINNVFSLGTVDECSSNYFTYSCVKGIIEIYVPLEDISSKLLPLEDTAVIVPSDSPITVQINSNIVQCGKDNTHAVLIK